MKPRARGPVRLTTSAKMSASTTPLFFGPRADGPNGRGPIMTDREKVRKIRALIAELREPDEDWKPVEHVAMVCQGELAGGNYPDDPCWACISFAFSALSEIEKILEPR